MPLHSTPSASAAPMMPMVGSAGAGKNGSAGSTSRAAAHMLPCALANGSTLRAVRAYALAIL